MKPSETFYQQSSRYWLISAALLILFLLPGCETSPPKQILSTEPTDWPLRQAKLARFTHWNIKGKLAVIQPDRSDSLVINQWRQHQERFEIHISSIFGLGATQLDGDHQFLSIHQPDEPRLYSTQPDKLLQETLGWTIPLNSLRYWIKGIPAPNQPAQVHFNERGNPHSIQQADWLIVLDRYQTIDDLTLPGKITLTRNQIKIKLAVTQWSTPCGNC